jgi:hypothetical protein
MTWVSTARVVAGVVTLRPGRALGRSVVAAR